MLEALLRPRRVVQLCDLPCGIYDPAQARVEAESVKAIQTRYQDAEKFKTAGRAWRTTDPRARDQGGARRPGQGAPVGAVDRLLQARAPREVPAAPRAVLGARRKAGLAKKAQDPAQGQKLLDSIDEIGKIFWETKASSGSEHGRADGLRPSCVGSAPGPLPRLTAVKDIGLVGVPFSGKSTLFTALTRTGGHGGQANHAVVPVPDPRVDVLTEMERSRKTVHAQVGFVDVPGGTASAQGIAKLREADALAIVVRCFGPDAEPASEVAEVRGPPPRGSGRDRAGAGEGGEADPGQTDARGRGARRRERGPADRDPSRTPDSPGEHRRELKPIAPLTIKPSIVVANLEEGTDVPDECPRHGRRVCLDRGRDGGDGRRGGPGAAGRVRCTNPGSDRDPGGLPGDRPDHVPHDRGRRDPRVGGAQRGEGARGSGGDPHDLERGFIRAEVVGYDELVAAGSMDAAKQQGKVRVEGKDYEVREGDILHVAAVAVSRVRSPGFRQVSPAIPSDGGLDPIDSPATDATYRIGEAASMLGVRVETLRRWEQGGSARPVRRVASARSLPPRWPACSPRVASARRSSPPAFGTGSPER